MADVSPLPTIQAGETPAVRRRWLRRLLIAAGILVVLLILAVAGARLYFSDARIQSLAKSALKDALGRDCEIGAVHLGLLSGQVEITGVRVLNADKSWQDSDTARIGSLKARLALWPAVFSFGKKITGVNVEIQKPEIIVERKGEGAAVHTNIDDLITRFTAGPSRKGPIETGLRALQATVKLSDGTVILRDAQFGKSSIEKINFDATLPALGEKLQARLGFKLVVPPPPLRGRAGVGGAEVAQNPSPYPLPQGEGEKQRPLPQGGEAQQDRGGTFSVIVEQVRCIDEKGVIDTMALKDLEINIRFWSLDVAALARCFGVGEGSLGNGKYQWTVGQPFCGELKVESQQLSEMHITANVYSDGVFALYRGNKRAAAGIPALFTAEVRGGLANGAWTAGPCEVNFLLAATPEAVRDMFTGGAAKVKATSPLFSLEVNAGAEDQAGRKFSGMLYAALDDLCATDVGAALGLKGQLGGKVRALLDAQLAKDGHVAVTGRLGTENYALKGVRQNSRLDAQFDLALAPNAAGALDSGEMTFLAKAASFEIRSTEKVKLSSLSDPKNLAANGQLEIQVRGRELWREFAPLMDLLGLKTPLAEAFDGGLSLSGGAGKVDLRLAGQLTPQDGPGAPLALSLAADYDGSALAAQPERPCATVTAALSTPDKSLDFQLEASVTRGKTAQTVSVKKADLAVDLSELARLNERFGAYAPRVFGPKFTVSGRVKETGKANLVQTLNADGTVTGQSLTASSEVAISQFNLHLPASTPGQPPLVTLTGAWGCDAGAPLRISAVGGELSVAGTLSLDAADLSTAAAEPYFKFNKPVGEPLKLAFAVKLDKQNAIHVDSCQVTGGPQGVTLSKLVYDAASPKIKASLGALTFADGPLAGTISDVALDGAADTARATLDLPKFDLARLAALGVLPKSVTASGAVEDIHAAYAGKLSALQNGFGAGDTVALGCKFQNVTIEAAAPDATIVCQIAGALAGDQTSLKSTGLKLALTCTAAGKEPVVQRLSFAPEVASRQAGVPLWNAVSAPGLPLNVKLAITCDAPLDTDALLAAVDALQRAVVPPAPAAAPSSGGGLDAIRQLRVDVSLNAPALTSGSLRVENIAVKSVVFDALKVKVTDAQCRAFGGDVSIRSGDYDLSQPKLVHSTVLDIANLDLHKLTSGDKPAPKDEYEVLGTVSVSGLVSGAGFAEEDRKSFAGKLKIKVAGLVAQKQGGKAEAPSLKKVGTKLGSMLLDQQGLGKVARVLDWYSEDFGLFLNKLEFEPIETSVTIDQGHLTLPRTAIIGTGKSAGLQVDAEGGINLLTQALAPNLTLRLIKLTPKTQEQLRLNQLNGQDRQTILNEFATGKFTPIILTGKLDSPACDNKTAIAQAFYDLDDRIDRLLGGGKGKKKSDGLNLPGGIKLPF